MSDIIGEIVSANISGEILNASINGNISAGTVILNEYVLTVSNITGGHRLTVTKSSQTQTLDIMDGTAGTSPVVTIAEIQGGHTVTITDDTRSHTFNVMDGQDAEISDDTIALDKVWSSHKISSQLNIISTKIPSQATAQNQLADKAFVNSSIATNTAYFRGTFNSVAELQAYTGEKTNNDYAFVIQQDGAGNTIYKRYKWNSTAWVYEYSLNNSSFTANQWTSIQSGITDTLVTKLDSIDLTQYRTASAQDIIDAAKESNSNKVTAISAQSNDVQYPSAKCVYDIIGNIESILDSIIGGNA